MASLDSLPDELLFQIISYISYTATFTTVQCPHLYVKLVNRRLHQLADSNEMRCKVYETQMPELAKLNHYPSHVVTSQQLTNRAAHDAKTRRAIAKVLSTGSQAPKAIEAVTLGIYFLDKMSAGLMGADLDTNLYLIAYCVKDLFNKHWMMTMRYTVRRIYEAMFPTEAEFAASYGLNDAWEASRTGINKKLAKTIKRRSFETGLLTNFSHRYITHIINQNLTWTFDSDMIMIYLALRRALYHMDEKDNQSGLTLDDIRPVTKEHSIEFAKSKRWRMLSCIDDVEEMTGEEEVQTEIYRALHTEAVADGLIDQLFEEPERVFKTARGAKFSELKETGFLMAVVAQSIRKGKISSRLKKYMKVTGIMGLSTGDDDFWHEDAAPTGEGVEWETTDEEDSDSEPMTTELLRQMIGT
ncbi:hypothetical protein LTR64_002402 [Lithohypha guttulata]|uniref:uncharacterized protein n=1 Tax=Lithohypha guttulata TaxID=1690604 RepID=UPI002DDEDE3A|nr:hypothetical protein LTR51_001373 [Lithohypha guttulata]